MRLFIYGTLKRGFCRGNILENQTFIDEVETQPLYRLYDCGQFPAMVKDETCGQSIKGELWEVDEDCLKVMDCIEGVPLLYDREVVLLKTYDNVEAYIYQLPVSVLKDCGKEWL